MNNRKTKAIYLKLAPLDMSYCVTKVVDSIEYSPGQALTKNEVRALCMLRDWRVDIT